MTIEEAINELSILSEDVDRGDLFVEVSSSTNEALNMAIKALEQESCVVNTKDLSDDEIKKLEEIMKKVTVQVIPKEPCGDAISRQAVLDKIKEVCFSREKEWIDFRISQGSNGQRDLVINFIENLPNVHPKSKTEVLDKIRAEIVDLANSNLYRKYQQKDNIELMRAVQIIDKYKESEDRE